VKLKEKRKDKEALKEKEKKDKKESERDKKDKQRKDKEREKEKGKEKPKARPKGDGDKRKEEDSDDDIEKEKEKDKLAFLAAIKGLREKDKKVEKKKPQSETKKKLKNARSSSSDKNRKERREKRRRSERSRSKDDESSGSDTPEKPKKETALVTSSGFGAPLALVTSIVPAAVGASDVIGVFCRSAGADQNSEQALRALPAHLQQAVMAEGSIAGLNPSAVLMGRIRKVENNAGASAAAAGLHRPRPETVAAAAAGDPVAKFCMQHAVDYSAENALRALPVELQCRILNEGPLRASNPSAVLMSRIRKAQTLLAEMRRLGKVPV